MTGLFLCRGHVFPSHCVCIFSRHEGTCFTAARSGLVDNLGQQESGIKMSEVAVIETGEINHCDLQGESGRLFMLLSNSAVISTLVDAVHGTEEIMPLSPHAMRHVSFWVCCQFMFPHCHDKA